MVVIAQIGVGSSPLARGTLAGLPDFGVRHRLIPARAGNTLHPAPSNGRTAAHPRSRGEHVVQLAGLLAALGSSPLARGTQPQVPNFLGLLRLIPARAGNTSSSQGVMILFPAHPRSRGEHGTLGRVLCGGRGSSPLARGTQDWLRPVLGTPRLIPARAGNT